VAESITSETTSTAPITAAQITARIVKTLLNVRSPLEGSADIAPPGRLAGSNAAG
jgi:hypothetical protein